MPAGKIIKAARNLEGMSLLEFGAKSGLHYSVLSQIEHGWRIPTPDQMKKIESALPNLKKVERILKDE